MQDSTIALIGLFCTIIGAAIGILGYQITKKKDTREAQANAKKQTLVETKLDYLIKSVDDKRRDEIWI